MMLRLGSLPFARLYVAREREAFAYLAWAAHTLAGRWTGGDGCHREVVFAPLDYNPDGSLVPVRPQVGSYVRSLAF